MRKPNLALAAALLALAAASAACTPAAVQPTPEPQASAPATSPAPTAPSGVIVFDRAHGEIFAPEDTSELGQSRVVEQMRAGGYEVRVNADTITAETLDGVAALYAPGPMRPFTAEEQAVIDDYVERGGTVVLTVHVPYAIRSMPARWGLPVGTGVMQITSGLQPGQDPGVFGTEQIIDDPLTEGVEQVVIVSGWPLFTDKTRLADAKLVVLANGPVAADTNNNNAYDAGDDKPPYGVVGVAPVGSGRVVVVGDDAIFANVGIVEGDNARLLDNILKLIKAPKGA